MLVEIIKDTVAGGKTVKQGEQVPVNDSEGRLLLALNRAKPCAEKKAEPAKGKKG